MRKKIRELLWKILGFSHNHMVKVTDLPYLKNDTFTRLGEGTYDNNALVYRWTNAILNIGKYCSISYGVKFIMDDGGHTYNLISSYPFPSNRRDINHSGIIVGNDVWIGMNAIILYGVTIGDGATIAAGAVVTKDVEPYTVVAGVPARKIKEKCSPAEAVSMQEISWWNWEKEIINERLDDFKLPYHDFISKYK